MQISFIEIYVLMGLNDKALKILQPTKKSFHHSGGIPVQFHWSHGKLLENNWKKWYLWNSSEITLEFQQFIILIPFIKIFCGKLEVK